MSTNRDIGVRQAGGLAIGAKQPPSAIAESITVGVSAGVTFSATVQHPASISFGVSAAVTQSVRVEARAEITLDADAGFAFIPTVQADAAIALVATVDFIKTSNADQFVDITLSAALEMGIRRFQDADLAIGVGVGLAFVDGLAGATPGTFRPDGPSGPAGIFRAIDAGDASPGRFRSPGVSGATPGRFKPKN